MNAKSRSNYRIAFCIKTDCINRNYKCDICLRYSQYGLIAEKEGTSNAETHNIMSQV